jgi:hypothetical protein
MDHGSRPGGEILPKSQVGEVDMTAGAYVPNFHEGSRSEYLAQYVFSMFGSSAPVLHQEDYGIDLYCTLTERKGQRAWPVAYYSVQVKSNTDPWEFGQSESVQWVVEYPAALLLCVIDKSRARMRVRPTVRSTASDPDRADLWQQHRSEIAAKRLFAQARQARAEGDARLAEKLL